jgi:DNA-binding NarL/FixJ family response regulator
VDTPAERGAGTLAPAAVPRDDPAVAEPAVRVIVVDDQPAFRRAAAGLVAATAGFLMAGEADNGEAALQLVQAGGPALVLMDIHMPGIGGIDAARQIRTLRPDVAVLLMSTYAPADLPSDATACGAVGYSHKERLGPDVLRHAWNHRTPGQRT